SARSLAPGKRCQDASGWRADGTAAVTARVLQTARKHSLLDVCELVLVLGEVVLPGARIPDLHPGTRSNHDQVPFQPGVLPQMRRDGDPALLVGHLVMGRGEEHPAVCACGLVRHRLFAQLRRDAGELRSREHVKAALLPFSDHHASREFVSKLGRKDEPTLVVQARGMGAEKHRPHPHAPRLAPQTYALIDSVTEPSPPKQRHPSRVRHCAPPYSTSHHFQSKTRPRRATKRDELPYCRRS